MYLVADPLINSYYTVMRDMKYCDGCNVIEHNAR